MTKDERAIIDRFLAENELQTRYGGNTEVKSVADVEAYQEARKTLKSRNKFFCDLIKEYRTKVDSTIHLWAIERVVRLLMVPLPSLSCRLDEISAEDFEKMIRASHAIMVALAREFPADEQKGA